jgi:hypothetical protein
MNIKTSTILPVSLNISADAVGATGETPTCTIKRLSNNDYWTGSAWGSKTAISLVEYDSTNSPGLYTYRSCRTQAAEDTYIVNYKNTGTNALTISEIWIASIDVNDMTIEYDFATYTKAVALYYPMKRTVTGDPTYWRYVYTAAGGKPTITADIAKADILTAWADAEPV